MTQKQSENLAVVVPFEGPRARSRRQSFERQLELQLAAAKQTGRRLSVVCIRIDRDDDHIDEPRRETLAKLFRRLQVRLSSRSASADQVGWPWPDGLAIAHSETQDIFEIYQYAKRLLAKLTAMVDSSGNDPEFDLSIGVALYPNDGNMTSSLLDRAYAAAKRAGRWKDSGFCFASRSLGSKVAEQLTTDVALLRALRSNAVRLQLQPVFDLRESCLSGLSASPLWRHPTQGDQALDEAMESVGRDGIAAVYNAWLADRLCHLSRQWRRKHCRRGIVIKATRSQIVDGALAMRLSTAAKAHEITTDFIEVAIEGALVADSADHRLRTGLQQLADLGVRVTLANIGAQPLGLDALQSLPVQAIEFDPDMVSVIGRCPVAERMLAALIGMAGDLGLKARATSVRSKEQLEYLMNHDCHEALGPLLAPPMREDDIDRLVTPETCLNQSKLQNLFKGKLLHMH